MIQIVLLGLGALAVFGTCGYALYLAITGKDSLFPRH